MKKTILDFAEMKKNHEKISMLTAYDYPTARLVEAAGIDMILVGGSVGMVVLGYDSTVPVTVEEMLHHMKAARRGATSTFIVVDLPFMSYATPELALHNAGRFLKEGGANAVKLEGGEDYSQIVEALTKAGIPVMGHIGLTPQTANSLGGFKVQGKDAEGIQKLIKDAKTLQNSGIFALLLEAIPYQGAQTITENINIPTIGIGAGPHCDGQVLVFHDLLGIFDRFKPKFVKQYAQLSDLSIESIKQFSQDVKEGVFPTKEHSFTLVDEVLSKLYGDK